MSFTLTSSPNELTRSLSGVVRCAVPCLVVISVIGVPVGAAGTASVFQEQVRFQLSQPTPISGSFSQLVKRLGSS